MNQIILKMRSRKMMQKNEICILLPEIKPEEGKRYPVLWLLHGGTCDYDDYLQRDGIWPMLEGKAVMTVIPNGLNSDFANHMEFGTGFAYTDFLFEELMPYVYEMFPASSDPQDNYLTGFSMGGAASLMLGLYRPEKFGKVGVLGSSVRESAFLMPYLDWSGEQFRREAMKNPKRFPTEFGNPREGITRKEINMISRYSTVRDYVNSMECTWERFDEAVQKGKVPRLFFCCGDQDMCCEKVRAFKAHGEMLGVTSIDYEFLAGCGHDRADIALERCFSWFGF